MASDPINTPEAQMNQIHTPERGEGEPAGGAHSSGLPPALVAILTGIAHVHSDVAAATVYYPSVGNKRRPYRSLGDVFAYESGFINFRDGQAPPTQKTPFSDGWLDAAAVWDGKAEHDLGLDGDDGVAA